MFDQLIREFKLAALNNFGELTIQKREVTKGYYIIIPHTGYPMNLLHYEILLRNNYEKVYLELHFEDPDTRGGFQKFNQKNDKFEWFKWFGVKSIRHKTNFSLVDVNDAKCKYIAEQLVVMLQEMEDSLGVRIRELATEIRNR